MIQGNDGGANVSFNGGYTWSHDLQPADRAVLSHRRRQPLSLQRLRHPAGQHRHRRAQPRQLGRDHAGRLLLSRHRRERLHRRRARRSEHRLCRRDRLQPRRRRRAAALRPPQRPDPPHHRLAEEMHRHRAARTCRYRFAWTFPIVFSPHDPGRSMPAATTCSAPPTRAELGADLARSQPERHVAAGPSGGADHPRERRRRGPRDLRLASSNRRTKRARSGPAPTTGSSTSPATTAATGQNVTPPGMPELAMSAASRSRRTMPTRSMSPRPATSSTTTSPICSSRATTARAGSGSTATSRGRDHPRHPRRSGAPGLLFVGTETGLYFSLDDGAHWRRMQLNLPVAPIHDLMIKGSRSGRRHARPLVLDPGRPHAAARPGRRQRRHAAVRRRARRSAPSCTSARWRGVRTGTSTALCLRHRRRHREHASSRTARRSASISTSARTRPTAPSSSTGWRRTARAASRSPSAIARAPRSSASAATTRSWPRPSGRARGRPQPVRLGPAIPRPRRRSNRSPGQAQAAGRRTRRARPARSPSPASTEVALTAGEATATAAVHDQARPAPGDDAGATTSASSPCCRTSPPPSRACKAQRQPHPPLQARARGRVPSNSPSAPRQPPPRSRRWRACWSTSTAPRPATCCAIPPG